MYLFSGSADGHGKLAKISRKYDDETTVFTRTFSLHVEPNLVFRICRTPFSMEKSNSPLSTYVHPHLLLHFISIHKYKKERGINHYSLFLHQTSDCHIISSVGTCELLLTIRLLFFQITFFVLTVWKHIRF